MQPNQFSINKRTGLLLPLAIATFFVFCIISCKEKKINFGDGLKDMEIPCAILSFEKITKAWPTEAELTSISYFTFYPSYDYATRKFNVLVQANDINNAQIGSLVQLDNGMGCDKTLPFVALGRINIDMAALGIFQDGRLKEFDNIELTPDVFTDKGQYLNFIISVNKGGEGTPVTYGPLPCPPCLNCRPICREDPIDTIDNDDPPIDTTGGQ